MLHIIKNEIRKNNTNGGKEIKDFFKKDQNSF